MLREKVWFKNMHTAVEQAVKNFFVCQVATPTTTREPLQMSDLPQEPWSKLSADFGHLTDGTYLLIVKDEYSHFVVVDTIKSTSTRAVIPRFDKIFAEFGIQDELKTDNGPPFDGIDFKTYLKRMGIKHRKITPRWPQANAETERFMRTIKKTIKAAQVEHELEARNVQIFTSIQNHKAFKYWPSPSKCIVQPYCEEQSTCSTNSNRAN
ncbi:transposon ty3-g Gag-Pol polyprotein [Plakobranchus ocellatus]|uniref:Transposon ty3-g Gag-Pol polyprotein n=1 Tax=Plakobranchus ocellatus TaxID=259542 RepID=A0AAV4CJI0_9GAST|nr:transposon ty3-g Gag-Pol polyprotein [Plakobranchus ocellatus]